MIMLAGFRLVTSLNSVVRSSSMATGWCSTNFGSGVDEKEKYDIDANAMPLRDVIGNDGIGMSDIILVASANSTPRALFLAAAAAGIRLRQRFRCHAHATRTPRKSD